MAADLLKSSSGTANSSAQHNLSIVYMFSCAPDGTAQLAQALAANESVLKSGRRDAATFEVRGRILAGLRRWSDAAAADEEAITLGSVDSGVRVTLARAYELLGNSGEARRVRALPVPAQSQPGGAADADAAWQAGHYAEAADAYLLAAKTAPAGERAQLLFSAGQAFARARSTPGDASPAREGSRLPVA